MPFTIAPGAKGKDSKVKKPGFSEWVGGGDRLSDLTVSSKGASRERSIAVLNALAGRELVNAETGIKAQIKTAQRDKIISNKAREKTTSNGFTAKQHLAVAEHIEKTWEHATMVESRGDMRGDPNIVSIARFEAPIVLDGEPAVAYLTVKESAQHGRRIYSLELQEVKIARGQPGSYTPWQ